MPLRCLVCVLVCYRVMGYFYVLWIVEHVFGLSLWLTVPRDTEAQQTFFRFIFLRFWSAFIFSDRAFLEHFCYSHPLVSDEKIYCENFSRQTKSPPGKLLVLCLSKVNLWTFEDLLITKPKVDHLTWKLFSSDEDNPCQGYTIFY